MKKVYFYVLLAAFFFATMEVALKFAGGQLDSFQLTFLRFMVGGVLLLPFAIAEMQRNKVRLAAKDCGYLLLLGTICIPVCMMCFQVGVMRSNASTAAVMFCSNPLFTLVFAHFLTDEKFNRHKIIGLVFGLSGLFFMIKPWDMQEGNTPGGAVLIILAAIFFALYTVLGKNSVQKLGTIAQTSLSFIFGAVVLLVVMLCIGRPVLSGLRENFLIVLYTSIFVTGFGYLSYFTAIKYSDATTGSIAFFIKPAIAPVIAVIVLNEVILWNTYVGIALILIGSYMNIREKKQAKYKLEKEEQNGKDELGTK